MSEITALFCDIGGVVLTNGWDEEARQQTARAFELNLEDLEARHAQMVGTFETGRLTLDEYLDQVVFWKSRPFRREAFKSFMFGYSQAHPEALALLAGIDHPSRYLVAALNNESEELNQRRIERFELRKYFDLFLSSCFLGVRKPDAAIFRLALQVSQRRLDECVFIDDRAENVEAAQRCGMQAIQYRNAAQLREALECLGVRARSSR
jgi:putative hydrolase of the HAD superfamily